MTLNQIKTLFEREYNSTFEGDFATYENGEYVDERQQDFFDGFNAGIKKQSALIAILLKPLQACDDAMEYMSEYDIPIMLPTRVKEALQSARDSGYGEYAVDKKQLVRFGPCVYLHVSTHKNIEAAKADAAHLESEV